ncbi:isoprenylcysteine carboxylmethyltransferase family protein [Cupriavidus pinatubonensis]|uniref:methyltransferase family protein n=1 Tax=Cupriavidus pinatubonensis TaxID=248026 RepID=UPI001C7382E8|nr:isoprenylcysteine carboxylmethyltransferase family protein [Cupriavidus pinatubonensis]QYY31670.1 isoprenylcysteine carboxylmethyltransferase family protein [Cupriavidus pinatubonensis]
MRVTPGMAFFTLAGTLAYLALPILGWGGIGPFFAHPARTALAVVTMALAVAAIFSGGNISSGEREDRSNRWVLAAFGVLGLLSGFVPAWNDRIDFWTLDGDAMRWFGVFVYAAGGVLRLVPVFILGRRFSGLVAIQPGHTLVTTGLYGVIRHPSYLGLVVSSLGWVLGFRSGVGIVLTMLMIPPLVARIHAEEALLRSQFGAEYEAYRAKTWKMLPGVF